MQLPAILEKLGFEAAETKTYLTLLKSGAMTVVTLAKRLGVARTTLYGFLSRLSDKGLVSESQRKGVKVFSAETPEKISFLFSQKLNQLESAQEDFLKVLPKLRQQRQQVFSSPRFQLYEGQEGLRNVLKDMLLYSDIDSCAFWPIRQMMRVLSAEFFHFHNVERIKNRIYTRAIWPETEIVSIKDFQFLGSGQSFKREVRIAPKNIDFSLGYWFYANKVAFLASNKEGYGFIIESEELVQTLKAQFEVIWQLSKKLEHNDDDVRDFLQTLK